jgi:hypothetical protein
VTNRALGGSTATSPWNPLSHTFTFTTDDNGNVVATYSWGNKANSTGWNLNQPEDMAAAAQALQNGDAMFMDSDSFDQYYRQAFDILNKYEPNHPNGGTNHNCKTETGHLVLLAEILGLLAGATE